LRELRLGRPMQISDQYSVILMDRAH
jgi:hypothetical protein